MRFLMLDWRIFDETLRANPRFFQFIHLLVNFRGDLDTVLVKSTIALTAADR